MKRGILFSGILIFVCAAFVVPGQILMWQSRNELEQVQTVPKENYQAEDSALAQQASERLSQEEKLQLIKGTWESERSEAEDYEMHMQAYEAVSLARGKTAELYRKGEFPIDLSGEYQNWYGWKTKAYKVVDTTFHTYTAYYWEITFEKFDRSETYTINIMEDGTVFDI